MCGIVGYLGSQLAMPVLLSGLRRLEYRGYDSAGVALMEAGDPLIIRAEGKLKSLEEKIKERNFQATIGIGHTRWATHGRPLEANAHPHRYGRVVLVHNGIIENYAEIKEAHLQKGEAFTSETDTEVVCHLVDSYIREGRSFTEALRVALGEIRGSYALVVMDAADPDVLYVARRGSPLVLGFSDDETYVASDVAALISFTRRVVYLENGDFGIVSRGKATLFDENNKPVTRTETEISWNAERAEKGGFDHFMIKEIFEQPQTIADTLTGRLDRKLKRVCLPELNVFLSDHPLDSFERIYFIACGSSWHAAMAGRYYLEAIAKIPVSVELASEFRYREPFLNSRTLVVAISQSGETADTLACLEEARRFDAKIIAVCNVLESSIPRYSDVTLYTYAGPEISVASTKAFISQLLLLLLLALDWACRLRRRTDDYLERAIMALEHLPQQVENLLNRAEELKVMAGFLAPKTSAYFIARGVHYPIALEGSLKLKEISYIHAEGYPAGEMKHGPLALLESGFPVIALAPQDRVCEKMLSNIQESRARGATLLTFCTEGDKRFVEISDYLFEVPEVLWYIAPIILTVPLQLLSYYVAVARDCEVDQPRNLAKSVTVE